MRKRLLFILSAMLLSVVAVAQRHSYAEESVLREGNVVKIRVKETGIHAVTYDELKKWGLQPEQVRVLGYGGNVLSEKFALHKWDDVPSVAFYMHKGADGVFGSGDYILFYARGPVGWTYNGKRWAHTRNPYSNYGYYFLSDAAGEQRLIDDAEAIDASGAYEVDWYTEYWLHEIDKVNLIDNTGVSGGGRHFYGETIVPNNNTLPITFDTKNVRTDKSMTCFAEVAVSAAEKTKMTMVLAGKLATRYYDAIPVSDFYTKARVDSMQITIAAKNAGEQQVEIRMVDAASGAKAYLDYVELNVPVDLMMRGQEMAISNTTNLKKSPTMRFVMSSATANTQIWCVTDGVNIQRMPTTKTNDGRIAWVGNNMQAEMYMAVDVAQKSWRKPEYVGKVANQNLHALRNKDYVIICPAEFKDAALRLAKKHEEVDHITWAVVTAEEVYNEFSSGTPDVTAYRCLMKMLYDRALGSKTQQPKNLLLMGSASYDNRNLLGEKSGVPQLLVYEAKNSTEETKAYGTDDYCGFMADNAGIDTKGNFNETKARMDLGVGRLPVRTLEQANQVVDKLCRYMDNKVLGKWKSQICFLADDGDSGLHIETADEGAEVLRKENPNFVVNKIYLDAHTQEVNAAGERYPLAKNQFDNLMTNGVLFMNYSGHGGYNNITNEMFMSTNDIRNMSNTNQGFWFLATCSFSHYDGGVPSAGEEAVLNPYGGAIGVLSACRTVYATQNEILNTNLCDTLFGHKDAFSYYMTLGEAVRCAKNMPNLYGDLNKMPYVLLADPALRLNYPTDYEIRTTSDLDTLRALTVHTIQGYVADETGDTATWFNGPMDITIWDKMQQMITNDNDETNEDAKKRLKFNDYPNVLFSGVTTIVDGKFEFTFNVPKDIRYNYGNGRIAYYAYDQETRGEGVGHFEDFVVGGSSTVEIVDTIGPELEIYLNHPLFADGDKTYEFPHFFANIYDENGINTVGSGIGHDLMMVIDEDPTMTYVLNDYFQAENNSYQRGRVSYKMPEMEEGAHRMTFRAWDMFNNSSTAALNFHVVKGMAPTLYQVVAYPNPVSASGVLHFQIDYDQPHEVIMTEIRVYNLSGQLIKEFAQTGANGIQWDLSQMNILPGIYIYQVKIKTLTSEFVSKTGKIIISK